jgi:CubicO group peptidase (beta-lactamase class C family)
MRVPLLALVLVAAPAAADPALEAALPEIRALFADWQVDGRVPGLAWGIVKDGRLVHLETRGLADIEGKRAVTGDTAFRIASMTKAFTGLSVLMLADEGKLRLDDPAATHVPEMRGWARATPDSPAITVGDLLHHTAGFVTDDPWGDRQQVLPDEDFSAMIAAGVPFSRGTATAFEYSNFGYALLGRIVGNGSGEPYQARVSRTLLAPLGMASSGFEVGEVPRDRLAIGYRFEEGRWVAEPMMRDGAFASMGGLVTTPRDYARWVGFLLSAWPPGEAAAGPARRATVRAMAQGGGPPQGRPRPGRTGATACRLAVTYGAGLLVGEDCDLGRTLFHGGGYPGYGSHMLLLPDAGVGIFAMANRTYAGPTGPVWDAALALKRSGFVSSRAIPVSAALAEGYAAAKRMWQDGGIVGERARLAMNFEMDRSAETWAGDLARLKAEVGACDTAAPIQPTGALSGRFQWRCTFGRLSGELLLAPAGTPQIQALRLARVQP